MATKVTASTLDHYGLSTAELASLAGVKQQTIRVQLSKTGSYFGLVPVRLPNDRNRWPNDSASRLLATKGPQRKRPTPPNKVVGVA